MEIYGLRPPLLPPVISLDGPQVRVYGQGEEVGDPIVESAALDRLPSDLASGFLIYELLDPRAIIAAAVSDIDAGDQDAEVDLALTFSVSQLPVQIPDHIYGPVFGVSQSVLVQGAGNDEQTAGLTVNPGQRTLTRMVLPSAAGVPIIEFVEG